MRPRLPFAVGALVTVLLAGCSAPASPPPTPSVVAVNPAVPLALLVIPADPRAFEGPSTALLAHAAIEAPAEAPAQQLSVTVTSHDLAGRRRGSVAWRER